MSWIDRIVEQQIAEAMARGELDTPERLKGKPLDLDTQRGDGWWAEQFVRRERSHVLHEESKEELARRRAAFWRAPDRAALTTLVTDANRWLAELNQRLQPADRFELFDPREVADTWRSLHPA